MPPQGPVPLCPRDPTGAQHRALGVPSCAMLFPPAGPNEATDSSVTATMPGMRTPPPKWRPAAQAGSITSSIASALARKGGKRHSGLGWDRGGCTGRAWEPREPSLPQPSPCRAQPAPRNGRKAAANLLPIPSSHPLLVLVRARAVSPEGSWPQGDPRMGMIQPRCPVGRHWSCPQAALGPSPTALAPKGKLGCCGMQGWAG